MGAFSIRPEIPVLISKISSNSLAWFGNDEYRSEYGARSAGGGGGGESVLEGKASLLF